MANRQEHVTELLSAYVDGQVTTAERALVQAHLASCGDCARDLEQTRQVVALLRSCPQVRPSRSFALRPGLATRPLLWLRLARLAPVYSALAAVLLLALVLADLRTTRAGQAVAVETSLAQRTLAQPLEVPAAVTDVSVETLPEALPAEATDVQGEMKLAAPVEPRADADAQLYEAAPASSGEGATEMATAPAAPAITAAEPGAETAVEEAPEAVAQARDEADLEEAGAGALVAPTPEPVAEAPLQTEPVAEAPPSGEAAPQRPIPWLLRLGEALAGTTLLASLALWIARRRLA